MKAVISDEHKRILAILRESEDYESIGYSYMAFLQDKIDAMKNLRSETVRETDADYIEILEKSLRLALPLVNISSDSRFKKMRRELYQEFELSIAKVEFELYQVIQIIDTRRILRIVLGSTG